MDRNRNRDFNPFLFPSTPVVPYSSSSFSSSSSTASPSQPSASSPSNSPLLPSSAAALTPCKILGRQCTDKCFAPSCSPNQSKIFSNNIVDRGGPVIANIFKFIYKVQKNIVNELIQGKKLTVQLKQHLNSPETHQALVEKILSSYDKALNSAVSWSSSAVIETTKHTNCPSESPVSYVESRPRIDVSDHHLQDVNSMRKTPPGPRWTEQVKICSGTVKEREEALADDYSWRKYGHKVNPGAKFPRVYYRCKHRRSQGCLAIKQVQISDEDPTILDVSYIGRHSCAQSSPLPIASTSPINKKSQQNTDTTTTTT